MSERAGGAAVPEGNPPASAAPAALPRAAFPGPVLVFLALGREARCLPGGLAALPAPEPGVRLTAESFAGAGAARGWFVASGMGPERAQLAAARLLEGARAAGVKLGAALSVGVAAALDPAWQVGDVVLADPVVWCPGGPFARRNPVSGSYRCDDGLVEHAAAAIAASGVAGRRGRLVTTDHMVLSAEEKGGFAGATGAAVLDMESAAIAEAAERARVPFLALRAISDVAGEDLGVDLPRIVTPTGGLKLGGLTHLLIHPSSLRTLNRLRTRTDRALANLRRVLETLLLGQLP